MTLLNKEHELYGWALLVGIQFFPISWF